MLKSKIIKFLAEQGIWRKHSVFEINKLPVEIKAEIVNNLEDDDIRSISCVSKEWNNIAKTTSNYKNMKKKIFYTHDFGKVRTMTFDNGNGGSGPIFVPIPSIPRHTHPTKNELVNAFVSEWSSPQHRGSIYLYEEYENKSDPGYQLRVDGRAIFKIKLKKNHFATSSGDKGLRYGYGEWRCKLEDIEKIIWAEISWDKNKYVRRTLNLPLDTIEELKPKLKVEPTLKP